MRALLLCDVPGWAFDQNLRDMQARLRGRIDCDVFYVREWMQSRGRTLPDFDRYDVVYNPFHRNPLDGELPWSRTAGSLRARWFHPERQAPPGPSEVEAVNRYAAFHVVNMACYVELQAHCPRLSYLTNPVEMERFPHPSPPRRALVAEWNGNAGHGAESGLDVKGFASIVRPACELARVPLVTAEFREGRRPREAMPDFYAQASVALCASQYEGASNSVMEAMAAGLAVVATDVGNHREMLEHQLVAGMEAGILLVDRHPVAFANALRELLQSPERVQAMGASNRESIRRWWSWEVWAPRYERFLRQAAGGET